MVRPTVEEIEVSILEYLEGGLINDLQIRNYHNGYIIIFRHTVTDLCLSFLSEEKSHNGKKFLPKKCENIYKTIISRTSLKFESWDHYITSIGHNRVIYLCEFKLSF